MKIYQFGKLRVAASALMYAICGTIFATLFMILTVVFIPSAFVPVFVSVFFFLGIVLLGTYNLNCLVVGDCQIWGWILALIPTFYLILGIVSMLVALGSGKTKEILQNSLVDKYISTGKKIGKSTKDNLTELLKTVSH